MLVSETGKFLTQRQFPQLTQLMAEVRDGELYLSTPSLSPIQVPQPAPTTPPVAVQVWKDQVPALPAGEKIHDWISQFLGERARLVFMPDSTQRLVASQRVPAETNVSFADAFPYHLLAQPSLDDLNQRLPEESFQPISFRPNVVIAGDFPPYAEDAWERFRIGEAVFRCVKLCARCSITTIHPYIGVGQGAEPLRMLEQYRRWKGQVWFGQNVILEAGTHIQVGDEVEVLSVGPSLRDLQAQERQGAAS
jgi:uncharacterized protein YcbX